MEGFYAVNTGGQSRFCDSVSFRPNSQEANIFDPAIRCETNNISQDEEYVKKNGKYMKNVFHSSTRDRHENWRKKMVGSRSIAW